MVDDHLENRLETRWLLGVSTAEGGAKTTKFPVIFPVTREWMIGAAQRRVAWLVIIVVAEMFIGSTDGLGQRPS